MGKIAKDKLEELSRNIPMQDLPESHPHSSGIAKAAKEILDSLIIPRECAAKIQQDKLGDLAPMMGKFMKDFPERRDPLAKTIISEFYMKM